MTHLLAITMSASTSLADPLGSSPVVAALLWLQHTLLGTIATTVAIIAVAWVGVMMLSGRVNLRHGVTVILGCFLLFGATSIAAGIQSTAMGESEPGSPVQASLAPPPPVAIPPGPRPQYDPYAGASVPAR